jgi:hypothetical protein
MIESPLIRELQAEVLHRAIGKLLKKRFKAVPADVTRRLQAILDEKTLIDLVVVAAECPDLETFRSRLVP